MTDKILNYLLCELSKQDIAVEVTICGFSANSVDRIYIERVSENWIKIIYIHNL